MFRDRGMQLTLSFISLFNVSFPAFNLVMFNKVTRGLMVLPCNKQRAILTLNILQGGQKVIQPIFLTQFLQRKVTNIIKIQGNVYDKIGT